MRSVILLTIIFCGCAHGSIENDYAIYKYNRSEAGRLDDGGEAESYTTSMYDGRTVTATGGNRCFLNLIICPSPLSPSLNCTTYNICKITKNRNLGGTTFGITASKTHIYVYLQGYEDYTNIDYTNIDSKSGAKIAICDINVTKCTSRFIMGYTSGLTSVSTYANNIVLTPTPYTATKVNIVYDVHTRDDFRNQSLFLTSCTTDLVDCHTTNITSIVDKKGFETPYRYSSVVANDVIHVTGTSSLNGSTYIIIYTCSWKTYDTCEFTFIRPWTQTEYPAEYSYISNTYYNNILYMAYIADDNDIETVLQLCNLKQNGTIQSCDNYKTNVVPMAINSYTYITNRKPIIIAMPYLGYIVAAYIVKDGPVTLKDYLEFTTVYLIVYEAGAENNILQIDINNIPVGGSNSKLSLIDSNTDTLLITSMAYEINLDYFLYTTYIDFKKSISIPAPPLPVSYRSPPPPPVKRRPPPRRKIPSKIATQKTLNLIIKAKDKSSVKKIVTKIRSLSRVSKSSFVFDKIQFGIKELGLVIYVRLPVVSSQIDTVANSIVSYARELRAEIDILALELLINISNVLKSLYSEVDSLYVDPCEKDCPGFKDTNNSPVCGFCCKRKNMQCAAYSNTYNGCGPENSVLKTLLTKFLISAFTLRPDYLDVFTPFCNRHDICYQYPGKSQESCDLELKNSLVKVCNNVYGLYACINKECIKSVDFSKALCIVDAISVYKALSKNGLNQGKKPYTESQAAQKKYIATKCDCACDKGKDSSGASCNAGTSKCCPELVNGVSYCSSCADNICISSYYLKGKEPYFQPSPEICLIPSDPGFDNYK